MNPTHTIVDNFKIETLLVPQVLGDGDSVSGDGKSLLGAETACVAVTVGAVASGANKTVAVKLQKSASGASNADDWEDIKDQDDVAAATAAIDNAGQNKTYLIELNVSELGEKYYVRAVAEGGSSDGGLVSAVVISGQLRILPPVQEATPLYIQS